MSVPNRNSRLQFANRAGRAAALEEGGEDDFSATLLHDVAADDFFVGVVVAFDKDVGLESGDQRGGGVFVEGDDVVDGLEGGEDGHAVGEGVDGAGGAFEAANGVIAVEADDEEVALFAGEFEVLDVAGVEDVEDAVGEDDFGVGVGFAAAVEFFGELGGGAFLATGVCVSRRWSSSMISSLVMGTMPNFSTSRPPAMLAMWAASSQGEPLAMAMVRAARTMSPAPVTS